MALVIAIVTVSLRSLAAAAADMVQMKGDVLVTLSDSLQTRLNFVVE